VESVHICFLSLGQATIERFTINKDVLVNNMNELSLISQRLIYDQIKDKKKKNVGCKAL